jgi:hypothetical protein
MVELAPDEQAWVAVIEWNAVRHCSQGNAPAPEGRNGGVPADVADESQSPQR